MSDNENDNRPRRTLADDRDYPEWFKSIGPEDEDPEVIEQNIEDSFSLFSEDDFESNPTTPSDMPTWTEERAWGEEMTFFPGSDENDLIEDLEIVDEEDLDLDTEDLDRLDDRDFGK